MITSEQGSDVAAPRAARSGTAFWSALLTVLIADVVTKYLVHSRIIEGSFHSIVGDWVRLTRLYNPGAAFGLHLGSYSRWILTIVALVAVAVVSTMYRNTRPHDWRRGLALGLVVGGALGNAVNRVWLARGVVDWIDIGIGATRWPSFNVADIGISCGAVLLAFLLWREEHAMKREAWEEDRGR